MKKHNLFFFICLVVFLASCTPQKRLDRLLRKHPELIHDSTVIKTVIIHDTLVIEKHIIDTVFRESDSPQVVIKEDSKVRIEYRKGKDRLVYLKAECKGDTIFITKTVQVPSKKGYLIKNIVTNKIPWWWWILFGVMALVLFWGIIKSLGNRNPRYDLE